jgi:hypothetical protein
MIQRYTFGYVDLNDESGNQELQMIPAQFGEAVKFHDYHRDLAALEQEVAQLKTALQSATESLLAQEKKYEDCPHPKGPEYWPCACSYDNINDVCCVHAPQLKIAQNEIAELKASITRQEHVISVENAARVATEAKVEALSKPVSDEEIEFKAVDWWNAEGKIIDPDTEDVPWYDKRGLLAQIAFCAGFASAAQPQQED